MNLLAKMMVDYGYRSRLGGIVLPVLLVCSSPVFALPSFQEVKQNYQKSDAVLLDRHGKVVHELRMDAQARRLDWVGIDFISPALIKAVIRSEDRRFYRHSGVDWQAAGIAAVKGLFSGSPRGASTITMQLASLLDKDLKPARSKGAKRPKRTPGQKWDQMHVALDLEKSWKKNEVLEAYLNLITFRGELQGISAAAKGLFDKEPHGLDEAESFLLASLIRSPNASAGDVARRGCLLAESMKSPVACTEITGRAQRTLPGVYTVRQRVLLAPHVARQVLKGSSRSVVATIDADLQRYALEALQYHLGEVRSQHVTDGALMIVENRTGDILAYIGNAGIGSVSGYVDGVIAKRQAGSTLKPFLYGLAFENNILTPASVLDDSPLDLPTGRGIYKPGNYEKEFKGMVSARTALASSLNIPAVKVVNLTGTEAFIRRLRELGLHDLESDDYYGPSAALGSVDVSLFDLVNAYRTLANGGVWSSLRITPDEKGKKGRRVFTEGAAFLISNVLSDRQARSATFGLENPLSTRFWSAVKTGTSKDMRDNWCIGYSGRYTVGVWVGNFSGSPMWNVSGISGAAPIWLDIMNRLHKNNFSLPPQRPVNIIVKDIEFSEGIEPARTEFFLRGTEPASVALKDSSEKPGILYPADGTIMAWDPDIPSENQRVFFEGRAGGPHWQWILNNDYLGNAEETVSWEPREGRYLLALVDEKKNIVDTVKFEVRGRNP